MTIKLIFTAATALFLLSNCTNNNAKSTNAIVKTDSVKPETGNPAENPTQNKNQKIADAATILARKQVPILCYHQIRNWTNSDSKSGKDYITPVETFKQHIKMLADSGYHTILPDELYNYLAYGNPLPSKPVMITFDDTDLDQYTVGATTLKKYGYKGVYFIMTVSIGKRGRFKYMDKTQIKELSDLGNTIGSHTYDHQNVKKYQGDDWVKQIEKPTQTLETITGKKIDHFAYPFGLWNPQAIPELKKRGFKDAYILATKRDSINPLFTIRRIIASGYWSSKTLHNSMVNSF
ncbi:MAG: polysaccharide deacetylase family protein [Sphingobacteriales bacterium]|nr:MAG: polysaccharide deacetylase family protein [Sphingobacteriales bacterium]